MGENTITGISMVSVGWSMVYVSVCEYKTSVCALFFMRATVISTVLFYGVGKFYVKLLVLGRLFSELCHINVGWGWDSNCHNNDQKFIDIQWFIFFLCFL